MPKYLESFSSSGETALIEVNSSGSGKISSSTDKSPMSFIRSVANLAISELNQFPEEQKPSELEVVFGVKATESGEFAISLGESGNFQIKIKWSSEGSGLGNIADLADF